MTIVSTWAPRDNGPRRHLALGCSGLAHPGQLYSISLKKKTNMKIRGPPVLLMLLLALQNGLRLMGGGPRDNRVNMGCTRWATSPLRLGLGYDTLGIHPAAVDQIGVVVASSESERMDGAGGATLFRDAAIMDGRSTPSCGALRRRPRALGEADGAQAQERHQGEGDS